MSELATTLELTPRQYLAHEGAPSYDTFRVGFGRLFESRVQWDTPLPPEQLRMLLERWPIQPGRYKTEQPNTEQSEQAEQAEQVATEQPNTEQSEQAEQVATEQPNTEQAEQALTEQSRQIEQQRRETEQRAAEQRQAAQQIEAQAEQVRQQSAAFEQRQREQTEQTEQRRRQFEQERAAFEQRQRAQTEQAEQQRRQFEQECAAFEQRQRAQTEQRAAEQAEAEQCLAEQHERYMTEQRAAEQAAAEQLARLEAVRQATEQRRDRRQSRLVATLTWSINGIEWAFILVGMASLGGLLGFFVGCMIVLTGALVLALVSNNRNYNSGSTGVTLWFFVCLAVAVLAEYPALKLYYQANADMLPLSLPMYAGTIAAMIAILSFSAVYMRRQQSLEN